VKSMFAATERSTASSPWVSAATLARQLGVAGNTVRYWCREGQLRGHCIRTIGGHYRISREAADALRKGVPLPPPLPR
jgi:excisionase family DNA binding protein